MLALPEMSISFFFLKHKRIEPAFFFWEIYFAFIHCGSLLLTGNKFHDWYLLFGTYAVWGKNATPIIEWGVLNTSLVRSITIWFPIICGFMNQYTNVTGITTKSVTSWHTVKGTRLTVDLNCLIILMYNLKHAITAVWRAWNWLLLICNSLHTFCVECFMHAYDNTKTVD